MQPEHPGTRAADMLDARLEDRRTTPGRKAARIAASFALALAGGGGGDELLLGRVLVVSRRDSGADVLRMRAGSGEDADRFLALARRDLDALTVEQFVREWSTVR